MVGGLLEGMEGLVERHCTNPVLHGEYRVSA